ncbi:MAG: efflux RND transporter periplasmic adaptor subunit [Magnetococcales bacterium]|nr:efflux RND transporter periplasmic adaptor subunit [Magnetococcales bacterium]
MRRGSSIVLWFLLALASPVVVWAHGGEDHGSELPAPRGHASLAATGSGAAGDWFEVVITPAANRKGASVYLADGESNAPVEAALIEVESAGTPPWRGTASPTRAPGVYDLSMALPDGAFDLTLTVTAGEKNDLILVSVSPLPTLATAAVASSPTGTPSRTGRMPLLAGVALSGVLVGYLLGRARGRKGLLSLLLAGVVMLSPGIPFSPVAGEAFAHGGEDHGDQKPSGDVPSVTTETALPKSTQFLLGIRTLSVGPHEAAATVRLVGRVIPDPSAYARVQPSLTARVGNDPNFPVPVSGQRVKRGQPLAILDPNLSANDRLDRQTALLRAQSAEATPGRELLLAPIDGVVTDVHIVPGEVVNEQTVVAEIVQPDRLWVEAVLFDLSLVERITGAMAETRLLPGKRFRLRLVGISPKLSAEDQGLHLQFAVEETRGALRLGIPLDVQAELETVAMPLAVPREALLEKGGEPCVWVKIAPEIFAIRAVRPGRQAGGWTEILSGLQAGDKVVVQGQRQLAAIR